MNRYATGFMAGVIATAVLETAVFMRAVHRALTEDDSVSEDDTPDLILAP